MRMALRDAGVQPHQVGYVNAHATSTPAGDAAEIAAIRRVFGEPKDVQRRLVPLYVSSTKGATGHLLGAAGAVETIFTAWALHTGCLPPTLHLDTVDPALQGGDLFSHVSNHSVLYCSDNKNSYTVNSNAARGNGPTLKYALKNSFGFGGTNASLLLGKYEP